MRQAAPMQGSAMVMARQGQPILLTAAPTTSYQQVPVAAMPRAQQAVFLQGRLPPAQHVMQVQQEFVSPAPVYTVHHAVHAVHVQGGLPRFVTTGFVLQRRELVRQVGDAVQLSALGVVQGSVPTFQCKICLSNLPLSERVVFQECHNADHGCCRDCTRIWIEERVKSGQVHSLLCQRRGNVECSAKASDEEVMSLTDEETFQKYKRFILMREDDMMRECPYCGHFSRPNVVAGEITAEMVCPACSSLFCFYHSNAHAGRPCDEYSRQISRQLKEMQSGALADAKQCPKCGVHTVKLSGCNHMTCGERTCGAHWCWVCEQHIVGGNEGVLEHYSTGTCRQFPDVDDTTTPGCWLTFLRVFTFPFRIFFLTLATVLIPLCVAASPIMLTLICCGLTICSRGRAVYRQNNVKLILVIPALLVFVTLAILYSLLVGLLVLFIVQCFSICVPHRFGDFDHTHVVWLWSLPFTSLEPLRPCMRCYFKPWPWPSCCDEDDELEEDEEGPDNEEEFDSN